jgi:hypothetical protein
MFDPKDAYCRVTLDEILKKVSERQLWMYYCRNFDGTDKPFLSELYNDKNPDCRIFKNSYDNKLLYKDFGDGGKVYDIVQYVMVKYGCTFRECIDIIANDFNIRKSRIIVNRAIKVSSVDELLVMAPKTKIDIVSQPFTIADYNYWNQYHIPLELLDEYNVFSAKYIHLYKGDRVITFAYAKSNPIYAYRFVDEETREYNYKVYRPLEPDKRYKWMFSGKAVDIEGYDQLRLSGDLLILTKSLKDCMVYRLLGYDAISLQGETNKLSNDIVNKIRRRFDRILVNYDNDEEGVRGSIRLREEHGFKYFFVDETKDVSDYVKKYGLENTKRMIEGKIREDEQ